MPPPGPVQYALMVISAVLFTLAAGLTALGVWMCVHDFPTPMIIPGALCVLLGVTLRPRLPRRDRTLRTVDRAEAPALWDLLDRVAAAVGIPVPHVVCFDPEVNASVTVAGLLRRRVLTIGVPLWLALGPAERVALLGHELGHFRNGDLRDGLLKQPALRTFAELAMATRPAYALGRAPGLIGLIVAWLMMFPLHLLFASAQLGVRLLAARDSQRDEYRADRVAAGMAGTTATARLLDILALGEGLGTITSAKARAQEFTPAEVRTAVAAALERRAPRRDEYRLWTVRGEIGLYTTHPPAGLRAALVTRLGDSGAETGAMPAGAAEAAERVDDELTKVYAEHRRAVAYRW